MAALSNPFNALLGEREAPFAKAGLRSPVGGITGRVTSGFGLRSAPVAGASTNHAGVDISPQSGASGYPAEAAADGTVTYAGPMGGYGTMVEVTHEDGTKTRYGHLAGLTVKTGDVVKAGTPVGVVGAGKVGRSSAPHLHFEVIDKTGKKIDPRSVVDFAKEFAARGLSVTPTPRPDTLSGLMSFDTVAPSAPPSAPSMAGFDTSRFGAPAGPDPSRFGGPISRAPAGPVGPMGGYAVAEAPAGFGMQPSAGRFAGPSMPSADRFGYSPSPSMARVSAPFSPAGSYATAEAPTSNPGGLGSLGGMVSTPKTGRISSSVTPASSTPMAAAPSQPMSSPLSHDLASAGFPTSRVTTTSVAPSSMGLLASTSMAPAGSFSTFNAVPTNFNAMTDMVNTMAAQPLSMPNMPAIPSIAPPTVTPMVTKQPVTPTVRAPVSAQTTASVNRAPVAPSFTAADVYSGRAPVGAEGVASGGNVVSKDQYGNTHVTNSFGVTSVTDPNGRSMGTVNDAVGKAIANRAPGMVGGLLGGLVGGPVGSVIGAVAANKAAGKKTGGLGGLGGFLSGLFGGGSSSGGSRGGSSSGSSSGGGLGVSRASGGAFAGGGTSGGGSRGGDSGRGNSKSKS